MSGLETAGVAAGRALFQPSALDRFFDAIERQPGAGWWVFPLIYVGLVAYHHVAMWATGSLPFGSINVEGISSTVYGPYGLAAMYYFTRLGGRAIDEFRPASGLTDTAFADVRRELTTLPAGRWLVALGVGSVVAIGSILTASPAGLAPYGGPGVSTFVVLLPAAVLGYGLMAVDVYLAVRQLRIVQALHRTATAIDLFDTGPIYAFSRLTARIGLAFAIGGYYSLAANGSFQAGNAFASGVIVGVVLLGVAFFLLPLWGIHSRLVEAKTALVRGASLRAQALHEALFRRVDGGDLTGMKDLADALAGVRAASERIDRLPTWPWPPQLLRGFVSAILLPVAVFLITRIVSTQIR